VLANLLRYLFNCPASSPGYLMDVCDGSLYRSLYAIVGSWRRQTKYCSGIYFNDFFAILTLNTIYIDGINVTRKGTRMLCAFPFVSIRVFEPGFDVFDRSFERSVHSKV